jgi:cephalosporin-C deacetylase-like acetyl esterase
VIVMQMTGHSGVLAGLVLLALAVVPALGAPVLKNYWAVQGDRMSFASDEMQVQAALPHGFASLQVQGHEFLRGGPTFGGIAFRKADGTWITRFTDISNASHDASHGRRGAVSDGEYLLTMTTGWSLPQFTLYAGYNNPTATDLVLFLADDVRAVRLVNPGSAISMSRQMVTPGSKAGTSVRGGAVAVVHNSGVVLRLQYDAIAASVLTAPDGTPRLAVSIPLKGLAANTITCSFDTHAGTDALAIFPRLEVQSPTMGRGDSGYKPQSNGYWALYEKDATVDYTVSFDWLGRAPFEGTVVVEARHALGQPHLRVEAKPTAGASNGTTTTYSATVRPRFTMPGVSEVSVHLLDATGVVLMTERLRILYDWPSYRATHNAPPDLNAFWDGTLAELAKVPLDPKIEAVLFKDDPEWEFQHVSFAGWQGKRIHACLYIPKKAKRPLPVKVTAHPGTLGFGVNMRPDGVYGSKVRTDPRFVTIVPLIRGFAPDAKDIPFNQPWWGPLDTRDGYVARSWFTAMVRALDYLATRPELADMTKVVAEGGSQGGALALVTAALDKRVKVCIADSPSNCMHGDAVRPGTYATFGPTAGQVPPGQTLDDLLRTLSYYDPANLASRITCPTVIHLTVGDLTVHAMGGLGAFKNLTGLKDDQKWFCPGVNSNFHAGSRDGGLKRDELIQKLLE